MFKMLHYGCLVTFYVSYNYSTAWVVQCISNVAMSVMNVKTSTIAQPIYFSVLLNHQFYAKLFSN